MQISKHVISLLFLALAGLISGFLTIASFHFFAGAMGNDYVNGLIFGVVLVGYLWIAGYVRRTWKVPLILATSIVAYRVSTLSSLLGSEQILYSGYFIAGCIGAFLLMASILLVTSLARKKWLVMYTMIASVAGGGVLGAAGYILGPWLGARLSHLLNRLDLYSNWDMLLGMKEQVLSVHVVWQTGIAFIVGLMLMLLADKDSHSQQQQGVSWRSLRFAPIVFFGAILFFLALMIRDDVKRVTFSYLKAAVLLNCSIRSPRALTAAL